MEITKNFILGLLIGDGSFQINNWKLKTLSFRIVCKLKNTEKNVIMLTNIRNSVKMGNINISPIYVLWKMDDRKEILKFLNSLFKLNLINYILVPQIKLKIYKMKYGIENRLSYDQYKYLEERPNLWEELLTKEAFNIKDYKTLNKEILAEILCGLIEAEGCFCIRKNGNLSFSLGQTEGESLIEYIKETFLLPNKTRKIYKLTIGSKKLKELTLIETYNKKSLAKIINFINTGNLPNYPRFERKWQTLVGEKAISFKLFQEKYNEKLTT